MRAINLLPWRQQAIQFANKVFAILLAMSIGITLVILIFIHMGLAWRIDQQINENQVLQLASDAFIPSIKKIQTLKAEKKLMMERASSLVDLQKDRISLVKVLETFTELTPEGFLISEINRKGNLLSIVARSESYARISEILRRIELCRWLFNPILTDSKTKEKIIQPNQGAAERELELILDLSQGSPLEDN